MAIVARFGHDESKLRFNVDTAHAKQAWHFSIWEYTSIVGGTKQLIGGSLIKFIEWIRIVPDLIFGVAGVLPIVIAALLTYLTMRKNSSISYRA